METTYTFTKTMTEEFIVVTVPSFTSRTYHKQWVIDEIAKLRVILSEIEKNEALLS